MTYIIKEETFVGFAIQDPKSRVRVSVLLAFPWLYVEGFTFLNTTGTDMT